MSEAGEPIRRRSPRSRPAGRRSAAAGDERAPGGRASGGRKPRATLSMEAIVEGAIEMLDADGARGLTFRGLAAQLGGGVGSIYWYVKNKDELLQYATDAVVERVLPVVDVQVDAEPISALRAISIALFREMEAHPWAAAHLMHDLALQQNAMLFWEGLGQHLLRLDLTDQQRFEAISALVNYVVGMGAQMAIEEHPQPDVDEDDDAFRDRLLDQWAAQWLARDPEEFPFSHRMAPLFRGHDDFVQFVAGVDLILAGLKRQAGLA